MAKLNANLAALEVLAECRREGRWATSEEQAVLARWSGWGAIPQIFDESSDRYSDERETLRRLLGSEEAWAQARRTTLNAHYTSAVVAQAMWGAAQRLGFAKGRVLEPGCGSGVFLGFAPEGADLVGVELDATTARVAEQLYGARAEVHEGGFEDFAESDGSFDLVIGNVPFGKVAPYDPRHNRGNHTLHNYFLVKSLSLTRPGGLVVALTSRYTLDARNPSPRRAMARLADLVGAVRLPARAFAGSSGTDVVTDLLVIRRRLPGAAPEGPAWTGTVPVDVADVPPDVKDAAGTAGEPLVISEYFAEHGELVLGELAVARGMYREHELTVKATGPVDAQLTAALDRLVADATARGATLTGPSVTRSRTRGVNGAASDVFDTRHAQEGSLVSGTGGVVGRYTGGRVVPYRPQYNKDFSELRRLIGLRDAARQVLAVQLAGGSDDEVAAAQRVLAERYEPYRRYYGPLNRYRTIRTKQVDPETGERVFQRRSPSMGGFRTTDPDWPLVAALEVFDDDTHSAEPAPVFTERVVAPPAQRARVESAVDAVAVCLDETGMVTTERVAELLGVTEDRARDEMGELVFEDPETRDLIPASQYLAGNVRGKLAAASAAVQADGGDRWDANVGALERAMPRQLEPGEITARLGASWIPANDIEVFCSEVFQARVDVEQLGDLGRWAVKLRVGDRRSVTLSSQWGTKRASAVNLLEASLNQRLYTVYDTIDDGGSKRRVRNDAATLAARDKQEALGNRFSDWVWEDPARARRLAAVYNELFRSVVLTDHDGSHLSLPGLAATFTPRQHQRDAVARILTDGRALLAHAVGAGKTATMVMAAMELRRLGSASKPAVVVPNHMLEQFSREWLQLYPTARILIADSGQLDAKRRKDFVARCALGDWDGIVFTHSGFQAIPLGRELLAEYLSIEIEAARQALAVSKDGSRFTVKRLEKMVAQAEQTHKKLLSAHTKDSGVRWEETGIDHVAIDEAHLFKNRRIVTDIDGVAHPGSKRSQDLDAKLWALRRLHGPRTVVFSTATPVANSMAEMWVMQSYLQPDVLEAAGIRAFDAWAANFGRTHTALELAPDGASYRMKTRFARFQNVPELLGLYHQVADVRTADDLALPTPDLTGGKAEAVAVDGSDTLRSYVLQLAARAEAIRSGTVKPGEDNMLAVTGDGRRAALDLRLVDLPPDPDGKVTVAARRIAAIHHATRETTYLDLNGQPSPRPGTLQLVFCDVSTPAGEGWNAYDELRHQLARRGVPTDHIRYMQDAKTHQAKAELFAACRDGQVAVLIGSTETMGVGTNVQNRAIALHHLDAPWRPADIEQRDGRILRQGNQNPNVEVIRYVTEGSFDTFMWQVLERKAAFIHQVSGRTFDEREAEEIGEQVLSFAEVKALATGDPRIMEKASVDTDVARLTRFERAYHDDQRQLRYVLDKARRQAESDSAAADRFSQVLERVTDTRGDRFTMTIDGRRHTKRAEAGEHLRDVLASRLTATPPETTTEPEPVAQLAGLNVLGQTITVIENEVRALVPDMEIELRYVEHEWRTLDPAMLVQRLERRIQRLPETVERIRNDATAATEEADRAQARLGQPWEHTDELSRLRRRQQELDEALAVGDGPVPRSTQGHGSDVARMRQRLDRLASPQPPSGISI